MDILKIFYESIVTEAMKGNVNVYVNYMVAFSTRLVEYNRIYKCKINNDEVLIPTLVIKNKQEFDRLLTEYVRKALKYYDDSNYLDEVKKYGNKNNPNMICREKYIMMQLLANATYEDFNNPVEFLKKRIDFLDNYFYLSTFLGLVEALGAKLKMMILKDTLNNEASSEFVVMAYDSENVWFSPKVKFGISGETVYIYAIQNVKQEDNPLIKKINRKLYRVGEGFQPDDSEENLKDITASFLVTLNMAINYFNSIGYHKIEVPSLLIVRRNAKMLLNKLKADKKNYSNEKLKEMNQEVDQLQSNLTNKLIRTFLRLGVHYNNIDINSLPYELDSSLHMDIHDDMDIICNNKLLLETGLLAYNYGKENKTKSR